MLEAGAATAGPASPLSSADAALVVSALKDAQGQGFSPQGFPGAPEVGAVAYARAQHGLRLPVDTFPDDWAMRPAPFDADVGFAQAVAGNSLAAWLAAQAPTDPRYGRLAVAYGRYLAIAAAGGWPVLAKSPLRQGDAGAGVEALRARLAIEDPAVAPPSAAKGSRTRSSYDAGLVESVMRAQRRYGLEADGRLGAATLAALNVPVEARLTQIRANLERWRWAPRDLPTFRIELNSASAELELDDDEGRSMFMRAVVGRVDRPTPMFVDKIRAIVFNPPWNVPQDIAVKEIWPKIHRNPGYMAREGFVVRPGGGLQQRPGPKCALGTIKFELDNPFGVYLHDTPERGLFALNRRALSHGCIRLEEPTDLAKRLLRDDPAWPETRIDVVLLGGKTTQAVLRRPVPVFVFYWTAFVDDQDQLQFRPDVYGWDDKLAELMKASGETL
jgi:murein L,D-transpeptidase YcbB/YkuD